MIEELITFLQDDCYVYIMTTGFDAFSRIPKESSFYILNFGLSSYFKITMVAIYKELGVLNPSEKVDSVYEEIVLHTVSELQKQDRPFLLSINKKGNTFDVLFAKKSYV